MNPLTMYAAAPTSLVPLPTRAGLYVVSATDGENPPLAFASNMCIRILMSLPGHSSLDFASMESAPSCSGLRASSAHLVASADRCSS